jgi:hypothetical protein
LTIFVTDHGTGLSAKQNYDGQRPALTGADATSGVLFPENTFMYDARALAYQITSSFELHGNSYLATKRSDNIIRLYKRIDGNWIMIGKDANNDGTISEAEAGGEDFNGNGVVDADSGLAVTWLQDRLNAYRYTSKQWDTDNDGTPDVRVRHDGTRFVIERLDGGTWKEMGRDTNGDFIIDATDGGVDWNLDGNTNGQIGFHEGINLWGKEVLWDDDFADMLKPLSDEGIHIVVEMVSCFSGGIVPQLQGLVESVYAGAAEDDKHYNRTDAAGKIYAADEKAFLQFLNGIDPESWTAAGLAAAAFDDAVATGANEIKNGHVLWQTKYYESQSVYKAEGNNEYTVQLDVPPAIQGQVYDFEFILGLQKPRWSFVGFPQNLPAGLDSELVPGGVRVFGNQPIPDQLVFRIAVTGATVTDKIRIEYTDIGHKRLGYTNAVPGTPPPPPYIMFGQPLVCITHFNPSHPSSNSTIEWLFPLGLTGPIVPSLTQVTLRITGPGMTFQDIPTTLDNAIALYFLYGINVVGNYGFQILSARNTQTMQLIPFGGLTSGTVNVTFPAQQNVGQCAPPPL